VTKVLAIGLDGYEQSYGSRLMSEGALPALAALRDRGAYLLLEPGSAQRTGLAWEHLWSGLDPDAAGRHAAVEFDPHRYAAWQEGARFAPFFAADAERVVVFDTPYADFSRAPGLRGVVNWGAHDPGISGGPVGHPTPIIDELTARVGPYPADEWTYSTPWTSPESCAAMGRNLVAGVDARCEAAGWLLSERMPEWDLAIVVVSELHSAVEGLWHGVDPDLPLHSYPSATAAGEALRGVYVAADRLVDELIERLAPDVVVVFAMGGMGANQSDVQSMLLLPELLHRREHGTPSLNLPHTWTDDASCVPVPPDGSPLWDTDWFDDRANKTVSQIIRSLRRIGGRLPGPLIDAAHGLRARNAPHARQRPGYASVGWQPAAWYIPRWPTMTAFALPSFYDGRIRLNLRGREARGIVDPADHTAVCRELETFLRQCTDPRTGQPSVSDIEWMASEDPLALGSSGCDLAVVWSGPANAIAHPDLGVVGPVPFRRTGGHTGRCGMLLIDGLGDSRGAGDLAFASAFDVAPTLLDLIGAQPPATISGASLLPRLSGRASHQSTE